MKNYILENKKKIIIVLILIVLTILLSIIVNLSEKKNTLLINNYVTKLERKDVKLENLVCDLDNVLKYNRIPYFRLSNTTYDALNKEILTNFLLRTCYEDGVIDYEASLNDNLLSIAINISYETTDDLTYLEYKTYNINTNTNTILNNQEILNLYHLTQKNVEDTVLSKLREYYDYEKRMGYIGKDSFQTYLNSLEYTNITIDNMNLYIDSKKNLYIFKDYTISEGMSIDENFPYITIKFKLN